MAYPWDPKARGRGKAPLTLRSLVYLPHAVEPTNPWKATGGGQVGMGGEKYPSWGNYPPK